MKDFISQYSEIYVTISRLTVVSREAKEEAASARTDWTRDSLHVSILQEQTLRNSEMP